MTRHAAPHSESFTGADDNRLVSDVFGTSGRPVALLHGGGQTRHAWRKTAELIAQADMVAYAIDQRGHGDSEWLASGAYSFSDFARDVRAIALQLTARHGEKPVIAGASLGGIAALSAEGEAAKNGEAPLFAGLVLVDITPRVDLSGVAKVQGFMRAHANEGFATVEEAADAVAAYLPHRPRPRSIEGLKKNLRLHADGRWRWHWDPKFLENRKLFDSRTPDGADRGAREQAMVAAARSLKMPVLLVRGGSSELVTEEHARAFLDLVPHATYADVAGARHMVVGDRNDQFSEAIMKFLRNLP